MQIFVVSIQYSLKKVIVDKSLKRQNIFFAITSGIFVPERHRHGYKVSIHEKETAIIVIS